MIHTTQEYRIGDNLKLMRELPAGSIDTIITSPPYWSLRDYGVDGQIGLEPTLEDYHTMLLEVTAECLRVLKPTGMMFWNHGDSYGGNQGRGAGNEHEQMISQKNTSAKCLAMQNERLILRMIDDQGWILRNRIIWNKPNGMPSSVTDRFSNKYEPVYMLVKSNDTNYYFNKKTGVMQRDKPLGTKGEEGTDWDWREVGSNYSESDTKIQSKDAENLSSPRARAYREKKTKKVSNWVGRDYWFDLDAVRVPHKDASSGRWHKGGENTSNTKFNKSVPDTAVGNLRNASNPLHPLGKNPGDVYEMTQVEWMDYCHVLYDLFSEESGDIMRIPTQPYPESHFATFPTALIKPMIKAACPVEICPVCGMARERIVETESFITCPTTGSDDQKQKLHPECSAGLARTGGHVAAIHHTIGWTSCSCDAGWIAGTVLDPFCGSGTVLEVCRLLNRNAIGFDLNPEYEPLIRERSMAHTPPLTGYFEDCADES